MRTSDSGSWLTAAACRLRQQARGSSVVHHTQRSHSFTTARIRPRMMRARSAPTWLAFQKNPSRKRKLMKTTPKWRPIYTAPKDEQIILSYLGGDDKAYTGMGRWICHHHSRSKAATTSASNNDPIGLGFKNPTGQWYITYAAVIEHSRGIRYTWEERSYPCEPTHWMPLLKPCRLTK